MAIKCIRTEYANELKEYTKEYVADAESDVKDLPKSAAMSTCVVAESAKVYIVNASGEWVKFGG
jgi:hypothetical protein